MNVPKKINVLVIPDLFPRFQGDVQGIFVLDYLSSTQNDCNNTVLFGKLVGNKKGLTVEQKNNYTLYQFFISSKKVSLLLKPLFYILWFIKGYNIGKKIENIDIIHAHGSILSGTLSYLLSRKLRVPFIITEHQGPFTMTSENFWKLKWTKFIMEKSQAVLTVSNHLKEEILNAGIQPKKMIVTYNPVDTDLFELKKNQSYKNILFVGRLDNFKGALRSLEAFEKITTQFADWTFTIVGDGEDYAPIMTYLEKNSHLISKVILKGQLYKQDIAKEMQVASFLVFPSKHESFGLVIAEALSCGLPVIVGNATAPKEFVDHQNGVLVPPYDIEKIAAAMTKMIQSFSQYNAQTIRNDIVENFGFKNFGKKMRDIYLSTMNKP